MQINGMEEQGGGEAGKLGSVEVWPNPTSGKFQITSTKHQINSKFQIPDSKIEIVDLCGNLVGEYNLELWNNGTVELDISNFPSGIYFLRISFEDKMIVKKLIKL